MPDTPSDTLPGQEQMPGSCLAIPAFPPPQSQVIFQAINNYTQSTCLPLSLAEEIQNLLTNAPLGKAMKHSKYTEPSLLIEGEPQFLTRN